MITVLMHITIYHWQVEVFSTLHFNYRFPMMVSVQPNIQGCAKKLVPGCKKSSAQLQPAQAGHARLVLNKTVTFLRTMLYMVRYGQPKSVWSHMIRYGHPRSIWSNVVRWGHPSSIWSRVVTPGASGHMWSGVVTTGPSGHMWSPQVHLVTCGQVC